MKYVKGAINHKNLERSDLTCRQHCMHISWDILCTLQLHYGRDSVSNYQPHDCLLDRLFRRRSKKTLKLCDSGICAGNSPSPHKWPVARKKFPFDDVIMTYGKPSHESMLTWTKFRVILIKIQTVSFKKMRLKKSSAKRRPFYSDFTSLKGNLVVRHGFPDRQVQMVYLCGNLASISRTIYEQTYIQTLQKYMLLWHEK